MIDIMTKMSKLPKNIQKYSKSQSQQDAWMKRKFLNAKNESKRTLIFRPAC